jgi:excisionase family DNA binding protein
MSSVKDLIEQAIQRALVGVDLEALIEGTDACRLVPAEQKAEIADLAIMRFAERFHDALDPELLERIDGSWEALRSDGEKVGMTQPAKEPVDPDYADIPITFRDINGDGETDIVQVKTPDDNAQVPFEERQFSPKEASLFLGMSRTFLVRQVLERGELKFHMVGTHKRIYGRDLAAYKEARDAHAVKRFATTQL